MLVDLTQVRTTAGSAALCVARKRSALPIPSTSVPSHMEALMRKPVFACLLVILAVLMISSVVQAQTATISGRVTDPQGAVVSSASVVARNLATGIESVALTKSDVLF